MSGQQCIDLWNSTPPSTGVFQPEQVASLPDGARRYLLYATAGGTPLASAVRLRMHGEIKLKDRWYPFSAEQIICGNRGMIWRAAVRMHGVSIRGSDSLLDGRGEMKWKPFGILPLIHASGPDITRSAAGRMNIESVWLPSMLFGDGMSWTAQDASHLHVSFAACNEAAEIDYDIDEKGQLKTVSMPRWGNPDNIRFRYENFGCVVEAERRFGGYTIPSRMRVGWSFATDRFESNGEFFRVTISEATYR